MRSTSSNIAEVFPVYVAFHVGPPNAQSFPALFTVVQHFWQGPLLFSTCGRGEGAQSLLPTCTWLLRMSVDAASWREDDPDFSAPRRKSAGRASTSARIAALRVVRIDPSSGADTSSARTRGGGRPA